MLDGGRSRFENESGAGRYEIIQVDRIRRRFHRAWSPFLAADGTVVPQSANELIPGAGER